MNRLAVDPSLAGNHKICILNDTFKINRIKDNIILDQNVSHFADMAEKELGSTFRDTEGAGAAGGLGWSLLTYLQADLKRGIDICTGALCISEG